MLSRRDNMRSLGPFKTFCNHLPSSIRGPCMTREPVQKHKGLANCTALVHARVLCYYLFNAEKKNAKMFKNIRKSSRSPWWHCTHIAYVYLADLINGCLNQHLTESSEYQLQLAMNSVSAFVDLLFTPGELHKNLRHAKWSLAVGLKPTVMYIVINRHATAQQKPLSIR